MKPAKRFCSVCFLALVIIVSALFVLRFVNDGQFASMIWCCDDQNKREAPKQTSITDAREQVLPKSALTTNHNKSYHNSIVSGTEANIEKAGDRIARLSAGNTQENVPTTPSTVSSLPKVKSSLQVTDPDTTLSFEVYADNQMKLPEKLSSLIRAARGIKIYIPPNIQMKMNRTLYSAMKPGKKFVYNRSEASELASFADWLWIHNEYMAPNYLMHRLFHDSSRMFTTNLSESDLCLIDCRTGERFDPDPYDSIGLKPSPYPQFEVVPRSSWKFAGCGWLSLHFEGGFHLCGAPVPYFHSIYSPSADSLPPWASNAHRSTLLAFVGTWVRGPCPGSYDASKGDCPARKRQVLLSGMQTLSDAAKNGSDARRAGEPEILFRSESPTSLSGDQLWKQDYFSRMWSLYADSVYSFQPAGDTPTRRGIYDSWMLGCIPVISQATADHTYRHLFKGLIFSLANLTIGDVLVVLPDDVLGNATRLLAALRAIPPDEVARRRRRLGSLAPLLQWGWEAEGDALLMLIGSMLTPGAARA